ncbi:acylphosphatase [Helicobacter mustelae]|uniref:acylphosphatase n=1 Tax=Helicobacter mustelae (strain ATCC 43772 / CCUG 25715 / CIP 103759 / LMG 18044 / NCTC 12198 / R85-136P) TaxID=679897 RepID=D3UGV0_HELM1|nr:acylphosphatase [Helicobacter mustelae]CBG39721.1 putative acylphosphatase [Helicobacter mustelae 12198]SQH71227.1 acylphosphatase [Helicobacter mustelae]STP12355.1 acylphosphatase [Helicobacter mustelae]
MTLHILISGVVQGVGYRNFAQKKARELEITGSIRNLEDFRVEVYASAADMEFLNAFVSLLKIGPERARVDTVQTKIIPPKAFQDFVILRD